jgi:hypothetical protein
VSASTSSIWRDPRGVRPWAHARKGCQATTGNIESMVRLLIIGAVVAVAFTLYSLVDLVMTEASRARGVNKPLWVLIVVLLPVVGGLLWFMIGKGAAGSRKRQIAPDDDPRFTGKAMSHDDLDEHMQDLEERLRQLDDEKFPGEEK